MSGKNLRVAITFDCDALSALIGSAHMGLGSMSPSRLSRGEFSVVGTGRVLELLENLGITSTFFIPGHTALAYPDAIHQIHEAGHEIGHHGWVHEVPNSLTLQREREILLRGIDAIEKTIGARPYGYRAPGWELSESSVDLLVEHEFEYDSSMMGDDFQPYWCRTGDKPSETEPYIFGSQVSLVELPVAWHLDDAPFFEFPVLRAPSEVLEIWKEEFDYFYEHMSQGVFILTLHPETIGRGHRLRMLVRLLEHIRDHDVAFTTCLAYAQYWRAERT